MQIRDINCERFSGVKISAIHGEHRANFVRRKH
jgi:hypothetical protein